MALIAVGCGPVDDRAAEGTTSSSAPIHGLGPNPAPDTSHAAVVAQVTQQGVCGCSATLIGPRTVLLSAHCAADVPNGCVTSEDWLSGPGRAVIRISTDGTFHGTNGGVLEDYQVEGIKYLPGAYTQQIGRCDQANPQPAPRCQDVDRVTFGSRDTRDIMLYRLRVDAGQTQPSQLVKPYRVVTGIDDTASGPNTVHVPIRSTWDAPGAWPKHYDARVVGWGADDAGGWPTRLTGIMSLTLNEGWEQHCDGAIWCMPFGLPSGDCNEGLGLMGGTLLRVNRTDVLPGSGLLDGVLPGPGDSGSPLLMVGLPGVPAGEHVVLGVAHAADPRPGHGSPLPVGEPGWTTYAATFSAHAGPWIEERLRDWDGDGVFDEHDNCWRAWNTNQENCNIDAERAARARGEMNFYNELPEVLGDACDPVPCPQTVPGAGGPSNASCVGNAEVGWSCAGRANADRFTAEPIGSHIRWSHAEAGPADRGIVVSNVDTLPRFCQDEPTLNFHCKAPAVLRDDRIQENATPATEDNLPDQPYHRVSLTRDGGPADARGTVYPMDYGETVAGFRWRYVEDHNYWRLFSKIPQPPPGADCYATPLFGSGTCLSGLFWMHADTNVGHTLPNVGAVSVGYNGDNLANHYRAWAPDEPFHYHMPGRGWRLPLLFLWKTLPDPAPLDAIDLWDRVHNRALPLVFDAPAGKIYRIDDAGYGVDMTAAMSPGVLQHAANPNVRWLSAVEPSAIAGAGELSPVALLASTDGASILDTVRVTPNGLALTREERPVDFVEAAASPPVAPTSRSNHAALYSRVANGMFVVGGRLSNGDLAGDAWYLSLEGNARRLDLRGETLGTVTTATFAFRDRKLWAIDTHSSGLRRTMRLLRIDPAAGGLEVIASWPYVGIFDRQWLVVDREGDVMLVAASRLLRSHLVVSLGERDERVRARRVHLSLGDLAEAPAVDPLGVTWFVRAWNGAMVPVRRGHDPGSVCTLDELRKIR